MPSSNSRLKSEFRITLDGTPLSTEEASSISAIHVFLSRSKASAFEIVVSDPNGQFATKGRFSSAKAVDIELGQVGKLLPILSCEVIARRSDLENGGNFTGDGRRARSRSNDGPCVFVIRGLDRSHRLMLGAKTRTYTDTTLSDIARVIAQAHGLSAKVSGDCNRLPHSLQADETDFAFLHRLARDEGLECWTENKTLRLERPSRGDPVATFAYGESLLTFSPVADWRVPREEVRVHAWDPETKKEIVGIAKSGDELFDLPGSENGISFSGFGPRTLEIADRDFASPAQAETFAKAELTRRAHRFVTGEVEVRGDPRVKPGCVVRIENVGPRFSGGYRVIEANHFFDTAGFSTVFYVERDKLG